MTVLIGLIDITQGAYENSPLYEICKKLLRLSYSMYLVKSLDILDIMYHFQISVNFVKVKI